MSDHGDHAVAEHDLTDLYVFRKPGDPAKTILVMNMNPDVEPGVPPRARPLDPDASYDFMIDADGDAVAGIEGGNWSAGGLCETLLLLASGSLPGMCRKLVTRRIR